MRQSALLDSGVSVATLSNSSTFFFKLVTSAEREEFSSRRAWHSDTLTTRCSLVFCAYRWERGGEGEEVRRKRGGMRRWKRVRMRERA